MPNDRGRGPQRATRRRGNRLQGWWPDRGVEGAGFELAQAVPNPNFGLTR